MYVFVVSNKFWFRRKLRKFNDFMYSTPRFRVNSIQFDKFLIYVRFMGNEVAMG
jgi:IS1 family transposase